MRRVIPLQNFFNSLRLNATTVFVAFISLSTTLISTYLVYTDEYDSAVVKFQHQALTYANNLNHQLERNTQLIESLAGLFQASDKVDRREFRLFTLSHISAKYHNHHDLQALEWIPRIKETQRREFEDQARGAGLEDFQIIQNQDGKMIPADSRTEHFPVYFSEPMENNLPILGFDIASTPLCKAALDNARDTQQMTVSAYLIIDNGNRPCERFRILHPIYRNNAPHETTQQRRDNLLGFVAGLYNLHAMIDAAISDTPFTDMEFMIYDSTNAERKQWLFTHKTHPLSQSQPVSSPVAEQLLLSSWLHWQTDIQLPERQWTLEFSPTSAFLANHGIRWAWFVLGSGLLLTTLIAGYLFTAQKRTRQMETLARELFTTKDYFKNVIDTGTNAIFLVDKNGRFKFTNRRSSEIIGYSGDELQNMHFLEVVEPSMLEDAQQNFLHVLQGETTRNQDILLRKKDGGTCWVSYSTAPHLENGNLIGAIGAAEDITERKKADELFKKSTNLLKDAQRIAQLGSWDWDLASNKVYWSDELFKIFDMQPEITGPTYEMFLQRVHPDDVDLIRRAVENAMKGVSYETDLRIATIKNRERVIHAVGAAVFDNQGKLQRLSGTVQDITDRKQAENQLRQAAVVFESTAEGVIISDKDNNILAVNKAFEEITGYKENEVVGKNPSILSSGRQEKKFYTKLWQMIRNNGRWQGELWNRRKNGEFYPQWLTISSINDESGNVTHYVGVFSDITVIKKSHQKLDHLAHHDPLTSLPNRALFNDRLIHALQRAQRDCREIAVLFLDLDHFKDINDTLGHAAGDNLLQAVAERLQKCIRQSDTVARLGGDEFSIILEGIESAQGAGMVANKVLEKMSQPFTLQQQEFFVSASIGISVFPSDGTDAQTLLQNADAAMYRAKSQGRNGYRFYTPEITAAVAERVSLENNLRRAFEREEFVLYYQPQLSMRGDNIIGVEALLRWLRPDYGLVTPDQFIPILEESGLIGRVGEWVLRNACRQAKQWLDRGQPLYMAVNISGQQIIRHNIVQQIKDVLAESKLPPKYLELEITENFFLGDNKREIATLDALKDLGITLAIDDFGTGYSSLSYLKRLPVDKLKIDQSFIRDIMIDKNDEAIAKAVIALGHSMHLTVIAEGVETEAQRQHLHKQGCDQYQGFLYSQPLPAEKLTPLLAAAFEHKSVTGDWKKVKG